MFYLASLNLSLLILIITIIFIYSLILPVHDTFINAVNLPDSCTEHSSISDKDETYIIPSLTSYCKELIFRDSTVYFISIHSQSLVEKITLKNIKCTRNDPGGCIQFDSTLGGALRTIVIDNIEHAFNNGDSSVVQTTGEFHIVAFDQSVQANTTSTSTSMLMTTNSISITNLFLRNAHLEHSSGAIGFNGLKFGGEVSGFHNITISGIVFADCSFRALGSSVGIRAMITAAVVGNSFIGSNVAVPGSILHVSNTVQRNLIIETGSRIEFWGPSFSGAVSNFSNVLIENVKQEYLKINLNTDRISFAGIYLRSSILGMSSPSSTSKTTSALHLARLTQRETSIVSAFGTIPVDGFVLEGNVGGFDTVTFEHVNQSSFFLRSSAQGSSFYALSTPGTATLNGAAPNVVRTKLTISNLTQEHLDIVSARILTVYVVRIEGGFKDFSSTEISRIAQRNITAAVSSPSGDMGIRTVLLYHSRGVSSSPSSSSTATSSNITFDEIHQLQCLLTVNNGFIAATVLYVGRHFSGFTKVVAKNIYQIDVESTASGGVVDFFPFCAAEGADIVGTGTEDSLFSISNVLQRNLRGTTSTSEMSVFSIYSLHKISNFSSVVFSDLRQEHIVGRSTGSAIHASLVTLKSIFEGSTMTTTILSSPSSSSFTLSNGFQHSLDLLANQLTTVSCLNLEKGAVNFGRITVEDITQESIVAKIETSHDLGVRVLVFHGIDQPAVANDHKSIVEGGVHIRNISQLHCHFSTGSGFIVANILYFPKKVTISSSMNISGFLQDNVTATSDSNSIAFHGFSIGEDGDVFGDYGSVFSLSNVTQRRLRGSSSGQVNVQGAIIDSLRTLSNFTSVIFDRIIQEDIVVRAERNFLEVSGIRCHGSVKAALSSSSSPSSSTFQLSNAIQRDIDTESGQRAIISHLRQVGEISGFSQVILSNTTQVRISASFSRSTNFAVPILVNSFLLQSSITSSRQATSSPDSASSTSFRIFNVLQSHISTTSYNQFISLSVIRFDGTVSLFDCVDFEHLAQIHSVATLISDVAGQTLTLLVIEVNSVVFVEGYSSSSTVRISHTRQFNVSGNASNEGFVALASSLVASGSIRNVSQLVFENSTSDFIRGFSARDAVFIYGVMINSVDMAPSLKSSSTNAINSINNNNTMINSISFQGIRISNVLLNCGDLHAARSPQVRSVRTANTLTNLQELLVTDLVVQNVTVASGRRVGVHGFSVEGSIDFLSSSSSSSLRRLTISHTLCENIRLVTRSSSFVNQEIIACWINGRISNLDSITVFNISTISHEFMINYHLPVQEEGGTTNGHQPNWILLKNVVFCYGVAMMKLVDVRSVHIDYVVVSDLNVSFHQQHQPSSLTDTRVVVKSVLLTPSSSESQSSTRSSIDIGRSCIRGVSVVHVSAGQQQQQSPPLLLLSQPPNISTVHIVTSTQSSLLISNISIHHCELHDVIMNSSSSSVSSSLIKFGVEEGTLNLGEAVESEFPVMDSTIVMKSNIVYVSSTFNSSSTNGSSCALLSFPKSSTTRSTQNNNNAPPAMMKLMLEDNSIIVVPSSSSSTPSSTLSSAYPSKRIANDHILAVLSSSSSTAGNDFDLRQSAWIFGCNQWPNSVSRLFGKNIEQQNNAHFEFTCQSQTPSSSRPSTSLSVSHPTPSPSALFTTSLSNSSNDDLTSSSSYSSAQTHSHSSSDITPTPSNIPPVPPYISPLKEVYNSLTQASVFTQLTSPAMAVQALRSKSILSSIDKILAGNCDEMKEANNDELNELSHEVPDPVESPLQIQLPSSAGGFIGGTVVGNILFVPIVCLGTLVLWMVYKVVVLKEPVGKRDMPMFDRTTKTLILKARKHDDDHATSTRAKMMKNDSFLDMVVKSKSHHLVMNSFLMLLLPLLLACAELTFIPATNTIFTVFAILVSGVFLLLFFWVLVKLLLLRKRKHERLFSRIQIAANGEDKDTSTFSYDMNSSGLDEIDLEQMRFDVEMMKESMQIDDVDKENKKKHNSNNNRKKKKNVESRTPEEKSSSPFSSVLTFVRWLNSCSGEWKIPHMKLSSRIEKERQEQIKKMKSMMKKSKKNNSNQVTTNLARLLTPANDDVISDTDLLFGRSHNSSSSLTTMKRISREDARLFYLTLPFIEDYSESTASYFMFIEVGLIIGLFLSEFLALWVFGSCQALGIMSVVVLCLHLLALLILKPYINLLNKYSSPILEVAQIALLVLVLDVSSSSDHQPPPKDVSDTIATFQIVIAVLQIIVSVISGLGVVIDVFDRFHHLKKRRELHDEREELIPKYRLALLHHHHHHRSQAEEDVNAEELRTRGEQDKNTNKNSNQKDQQKPQKMRQRDKDVLEMLEFYNNNNNQKNDEGNNNKETELSASLLLSSPRVAVGDNDKKKIKRRSKKKKSRTALEEDNREMNHVEL